MTLVDEERLLAYLRSTAEIAILETFAPSCDSLWVERFAPELPYHGQYQIWNKTFPWETAYAQLGEKAGALAGWYYVRNKGAAPVLEVCRSDIGKKSYGRLYWAKDFAAPDGLSYDVVSFSHWVDKVFRWVRNNGTRIDSTWFLTDALAYVESDKL